MAITAIITASISVTAVTLSAKDINFKSTNPEWQADNVEDAMNDLYNLGSENIKYHKGIIPKDTSGIFTVSDLDFTPDQVVIKYNNTNNWLVLDWIGVSSFGIGYWGTDGTTAAAVQGRSILDNGFKITIKGTVRADGQYLAIKY